MTRPRSQQINDPVTRYSKIPLVTNPTPGVESTTISGGAYTQFVASSVLKEVEGVEVLCPAVLTATTSDPYGLVAGNSFKISVDLQAAVTINVTSAQLITLGASTFATIDKIVALINTTLTSVNPSWSNVASISESGFLRLASPTLGSQSSISISGLPATLQKLGFGNVATSISYGKDLNRGIVTYEPDTKGGFAQAVWEDGRPVISISNTFYSNSNVSQELSQKISTGQPVYGRITHNSTPSFIIDWYSKCEGSDPIISKNPSFASLGANETFTLTTFDLYSNYSNTFTATFTTQPQSLQDVINVINNSWNSITSGLKGNVISKVLSPYFLVGSLVLKLNGNASITVNFDGTEKTNTLVVSRINTAIAAAMQAAQGQAYVIGADGFGIRSITSIGESSTVEIVSYSSFDIERCLGCPVGIYKGWEFCKARGSNIEISSVSPTSTYLISAGSTALAGLGLSHYPTGAKLPIFNRYIKTSFPQYDTSAVPSVSAITLLTPEFMEAGDVPDDIFTKERFSDLVSANSYKYPLASNNSNAARAGQQARYGIDGYVQQATLPYDLGSVKAGSLFFPLNGASISFEYTLNGQDLIFEGFHPSEPSIRLYIHDDQTGRPAWLTSVNASKTNVNEYTPDLPAEASSIVDLNEQSLSFSFRDAGGLNPYIPENDFAFTPSTLGSFARELSFSKSTFLNFKSGSAAISDQNIADSTTVNHYKFTRPFSDNQGDNVLRLNSRIVENKTIFQSINGRIEVSCGDGVNTFGDFNGSDALEQIVILLNALPASDTRPIYITLKSGEYYNDESNISLDFTNRNVTIIGEGNVRILTPNPAGDFTIIFNGNVDPTSVPNHVKIENVSIYANATFAISLQYVTLELINCYIEGMEFEVRTLGGSTITNGASGYIRQCTFYHSVNRNGIYLVSVRTTNDIQEPIIFEACTFDTTNTEDFIVLQIIGSAKKNIFKEISFKNSSFRLGSYSEPAPIAAPYTLFHLNADNGLVVLSPVNDGRTQEGLEVESLVFEDCNIENVNSPSIILQLCSKNVTDAASLYGIGNPWGQVNNLTFSRCDFKINSFGSTVIAPMAPFVIGQGVLNTTIDSCSFTLKAQDSVYGSSGYVPDWFKYVNPSGYKDVDLNATNLLNLSSFFIFGGDNTTISNTSVNDIFCLFGKTDVSTIIYGITQDSLSIKDVKLLGTQYGNQFGNGTGNSTNLLICNEDPSSPSFSSRRRLLLNKLEMLGVDLPSGAEWINQDGSSLLSVVGNNVTIDNCRLEGWTTSTVNTSRIYGLKFNGANYDISNNIIKDTQWGIYNIGFQYTPLFAEWGNYRILNNDIEVGDYQPNTEQSSGIYLTNSGFVPTSQSIIIKNNYVSTGLCEDTVDAAIDCMITPADAGILENSPILHISDNTIKVAIELKNALSVLPSALETNPGDIHNPKAVIYGNVGQKILGSSIITPSCYLANYTDGTGYTAINNDNVLHNSLIGAETEVGITEYFTKQNSAPLNTYNTYARANIPIHVKNLPNIWDATINSNIIIQHSADVSEVGKYFLVWCRVVYSYDNVTYLPLTDVESFQGPFEATQNIVPPAVDPVVTNFCLSGSLNNSSTYNPDVYFDVEVRFLKLPPAPSISGVDFTVTWSPTVKTPKKGYKNDAPMLNNVLRLRTV